MDKIISIPVISNQENVKKFDRKNALIKSLFGLGFILLIFIIIYIFCYFLIKEWNLIEDGNFILSTILIVGWVSFIYYQTYKRSCLISKYIKKIELRAKRFIIVATSNIEYEYNNISSMIKKKDYFIIKTNNADHLIPNCIISNNNIKLIEERLKANNVLIK